MIAIIKLTIIAILSIIVGQIAKFGSGIWDPNTLSSVVGFVTLLSIFASIGLAKEK